MVINPTTLAHMRNVQRASMLDRVTFQRTAWVDDGAGGVTESTELFGPYPCRVGVSRLQRGEELLAGSLRGRVPWILTLQAELEILLSDDVNVGGVVVGDVIDGGRDFEVLAVYAPTTFETARKCLCAER